MSEKLASIPFKIEIRRDGRARLSVAETPTVYYFGVSQEMG